VLCAEPFESGARARCCGCGVAVVGHEQVLLLMMQPLVSDGWSMGVLFRELTGAVRGLLQGRGGAVCRRCGAVRGLCTRVQRELAAGEELARQVTYWRGSAGGGTQVLELPTDRRGRRVQSYRGSYVTHELSPQLTAGLKGAGAARKGRRCSWDCWRLLCANGALDGPADLVVGTPIAGREAPRDGRTDRLS